MGVISIAISFWTGQSGIYRLSEGPGTGRRRFRLPPLCEYMFAVYEAALLISWVQAYMSCPSQTLQDAYKRIHLTYVFVKWSVGVLILRGILIIILGATGMNEISGPDCQVYYTRKEDCQVYHDRRKLTTRIRSSIMYRDPEDEEFHYAETRDGTRIPFNYVACESPVQPDHWTYWALRLSRLWPFLSSQEAVWAPYCRTFPSDCGERLWDSTSSYEAVWADGSGWQDLGPEAQRCRTFFIYQGVWTCTDPRSFSL